MRFPISSNKQKKLSVRWPLVVRRVQGHSMVPVLPPGTTVLGLRWFKKLKAGDVIIFFHDGKEKLKRVSEIDIGKDKLYVIGDHSEASTDSRHYGWIDKPQVIARVIRPHVKRVDPETQK
ncbi:hypothetical protein BH23PAT1_BH23PAT1_0470 [soil metagenome]